MSDKIIKVPAGTLIGIATRTALKTITEDTNGLWQSWFNDNLAAQIPNRIDHETLVLYSDYEGDYTQAYSYMIGCRVSTAVQVPAGMIVKTIAAGNYQIFSAKGKLPDCLYPGWQQIWQLEPNNINRAYQTDYEVYGAKTQDPEHAEVDIYIGLKN